MPYTDDQLISEALDPAAWVSGERPYVYDERGADSTALPDVNVRDFIEALPLGSTVFVPEELDEVMFTKTELGWVPSY